MQKMTSLICLALLSLLGIAASMDSGIQAADKADRLAKFEEKPLMLKVDPLQQMLYTSCGEAAITMTYNYANLDAPITERAVIEFARRHGYFTADRPPYTTPADMVRIARNYADGVRSGTVLQEEQGLAVLAGNIREGEPVIIDVRARLYDMDSPAHFIVVTGLAVDPDHKNDLMIYYNDPLTGSKESARWAGNEGIWNAWKNNGDPGGSGWWMIIPPP